MQEYVIHGLDWFPSYTKYKSVLIAVQTHVFISLLAKTRKNTLREFLSLSRCSSDEYASALARLADYINKKMHHK